MAKDHPSLALSKHPVVRAVKKNPSAETIVKTLITDDNRRRGYYGSRKDDPVNPMIAARVSDKTTLNIQDINNIFQLLPDTELAMQILISSIISPKDMMNVELNYVSGSKVLSGEITGPMLEVIRQYFEEVYKIQSKLPTILEDCLFKKGSFPTLILSDNTISKVINNDLSTNGKNGPRTFSMESVQASVSGLTDEKGELVSSIGILGSNVDNDTGEWSFESISGIPEAIGLEEQKVKFGDAKLDSELGAHLKVIDNPDILSLPGITNLVRKLNTKSKINNRRFGMEAASNGKKGKLTLDEVHQTVFRTTNYQTMPYVSLSKSKPGNNQGEPLVVKLPPESVIPVHTPGSPEDHVGYFIILDNYGNPISRVKEEDYYRNLSNNISSSQISSQLLQSAGRANSERDHVTMNDQEVSEVVRVYGEIVERDLLKRLKNGTVGGAVEISRPQDIYRTMLARSLAQMGTQILYVPEELVNYIAFNYNEHGVGKSLLDDSKILASLRSMLMFSGTMASIKNSVGKTALKIELDPDDPDPETTVNYMLHQYIKNRRNTYPLGASNPSDIVDFLQDAGVDVQVSGNPAYPETKLDVEDYSSNKVMPDSDLEEQVKKKYFMSLGLSPETVDSGYDVEFATSIVTSNLLLAKRVGIYQDKLAPQLSEFIAKYVLSSGTLFNELVECVKGKTSKLPKHLKGDSHEELIEEFLYTLEVSLPKPDSAKLENQQEAFDKYSSFLDEAMESYISSEMFDLDGFEDHSMVMDTIKTIVGNHFKREWLRNNNVLPELMDIVLTSEDDKPLLDIKDIHSKYSKSLGNSVNKLIQQMKRDEKRRVKDMEKSDEKLDEYLEGDGNELEETQDTSEEEVPEAQEDGDLGGDTDVAESEAGDLEPEEETPAEEVGEIEGEPEEIPEEVGDEEPPEEPKV